MRKQFVAVPIRESMYSRLDPIKNAIYVAEHIFGDFYSLTDNYYVSLDPIRRERILYIDAVSKVKPVFTEQLEHWIESLPQ